MELESKQDIVTITSTAMNQIQEVLKAQDKADLFLRIYVQGGCGGIAYGMAIDQRQMPDDKEYEVDGLKVVVDRISLPYVEGSIVDFDTSGEKTGFKIDNPNAEQLLAAAGGGCASGSCGTGGCGTGSGGCC